MIDFVKGIFHDLSGRIRKMIIDLEERDGKTGIKQEFFDKTLALLNSISQEVNTNLVSADINLEELASNYLSKFNTLNERFLAIELYRYQVIVHYGENERYFNLLIERIYKEIDSDQTPPIVSGISNNDNYYWVYPIYEIIAVPCGEDKNLLNLPDLYHEIGHLIFPQYASIWKGKIAPYLENHFELEMKRIDSEQRDGKEKPILKKAYEYWKDSWMEEFTCDLIATYFTGIAYGWTNLKISAISSSHKGIYRYTANHPSDDSRMYVIFGMLKTLGFGEDMKELQAAWDTFTAIAASGKNTLHDIAIPQTLMDELVASVYEICQKSELRSYPEQISEGKKPISLYLNQAWSMNLHHPERFTDWEGGITEKLREEL